MAAPSCPIPAPARAATSLSEGGAVLVCSPSALHRGGGFQREPEGAQPAGNCGLRRLLSEES